MTDLFRFGLGGCYVGFDLAHAIGNIELFLHDWNVDFACWCNYKYVNASAGAIAGMFIHERHAEEDLPKLLGWWGHRMETRFLMDNVMELSPGPAGYRISNPAGLLAATLKASLDVFSLTSMSELRKKSKLLTAYVEHLLLTRHGERAVHKSSINDDSITSSTQSRPFLRIITPSDPEQRGCHLSIWVSVPIDRVFQQLSRRGVVLDKREPNVLRVGFCALYTSFEDCHKFVEMLSEALQVADATTLNDLHAATPLHH